MKIQKLTLNELKVKSFTTDSSLGKIETLKGGVFIEWTAATCKIQPINTLQGRNCGR